MYLVSWSGGKDSCFACYKALQAGYKVTHLINFISKEYKRVSFHGIEGRLIKIQSELAGIPLYQKETTPSNYESEFKDALRYLIMKHSYQQVGIKDNGNVFARSPESFRDDEATHPSTGSGCMVSLSNHCHALRARNDKSEVFSGEIKGMIFGDIYLEEHKQWVERVCKELGLEPVEPLWGKDTEKLIQDFIDNGFQAVIVSGQAKFIDKEWIGKSVNRDFLEYLKKKADVDICGENGEYHTFVVGGPLFNGRIEITEKEVINRNGYWFLDIKDYRVINTNALYKCRATL